MRSEEINWSRCIIGLMVGLVFFIFQVSILVGQQDELTLEIVDSAGRNELKQLCKERGLSTSGGMRELKRRLHNYLKKPGEAGKKEESTDKTSVGWWSFDEGKGEIANDKSPNKNKGTINGAGWTAGRVGSGLKFDGINNYVEVSNHPGLQSPEAITIEAWIYPTAPHQQGYGGIINNINGLGGSRLLVKDNGKLLAQLHGESANVFGPSVTNNAWNHVVYVYNGKEEVWYLNGVKGDSSGYSQVMQTGECALIIGWGYVDPEHYHFKGIIDEVKIYNRALSEKEIVESYKKIMETAVKPADVSAGGNKNLINLSLEEDKDKDGIPDGWHIWGEGSNIPISVSQEKAHNGKYSIKIEDNDIKGRDGLESDLVKITPAKICRSSVYASGSGEAQLYLQFFDSSDKRIGVKIASKQTGKDWILLTAEGKSPDNAVGCKLLFYSYGRNTGICYYDDAKLEEIDKEAELKKELERIPEYKLAAEGHPRLYFSSKDIERLKNSGFHPAEELLTKDNFSSGYISGKQVTYELPPKELHIKEPPEGFVGNYPYWTSMSRTIQTHIESLALSYLITGKEKYAQRVKEYLFALSKWSTWCEYPEGEAYGGISLAICHLTFGMAFGYDVIYGFLDKSERKQIGEDLMKLGLGPIYNDGFKENETNLPALQFSALGIGGLVFLNEFPEAKVYVDLAKKYTGYYFERRLNSKNTEGLLYTDYAMQNLLMFADVLNRVTGDNSLLDHQYTKEVLPLWVIYFLTPGGSGRVPFSDDPGGGGYGLIMKIINNYFNNGYAGWFLNKTGQDKSKGFLDVIYFNPKRKITSPDNLPTAKLFENIGWVSLRSDWSDTATFLAFQCSSSELGHNHYDQNNFVLNIAGEWLITDPGYIDYRPGPTNIFTLQSVGHNTILIDGEGQNKLGNSQVKEFFHSHYYDYVAGDASKSYSSEKLNKFLRHIVYLRPDYFLIFDQLVSPKPAKFEWLLQASNSGKTNRENNVISIKKRKSELNVFVLQPEEANIEITKYPGAEQYGPYAVVSNSAEKEEVNFLSLLYGRPLSKETNLIELASYPVFDSSGQEYKVVGVEGENGLFYRGQSKGDYLTFEITVSKGGDYEITSGFFKSPAYGTVHLSIDGKKIGNPYDGYAEEVGLSEGINSGKTYLSEGKHYFRYEIIDKNPNSGNYFVGIRYIELKSIGEKEEKAPDKTLKVKSLKDKGIIGAEITDENGLERIIFNISSEKNNLMNCQEQSFSGKNSFIGLSLNNEIKKYGLFRGNVLRYNEKTLFSSKEECCVSLGWEKKLAKGTIKLVKEEEIEIYLPNLKKLLINNQEIDYQKSYNPQSGILRLKLKEGTHQLLAELG